MLKKPRIKDRAMYLLSLLAQNEQMAELKAEHTAQDTPQYGRAAA